MVNYRRSFCLSDSLWGLAYTSSQLPATPCAGILQPSSPTSRSVNKSCASAIARARTELSDWCGHWYCIPSLSYLPLRYPGPGTDQTSLPPAHRRPASTPRPAPSHLSTYAPSCPVLQRGTLIQACRVLQYSPCPVLP